MDNASVAALEHVASEDLRDAKSAGEVGFEDGVPVGFGELESRTALGTTSTIDENVDFAESGNGVGEEALKAGALTHVGGATQRVTASGFDLHGNLIDQVGATGRWCDVRPGLSEAESNGAANPGGSADDDGGASGEVKSLVSH